MGVIETIGRFLDPIVVVRDDGQYLTPNGNHRLQALKKLGVKTVDRRCSCPIPTVAFKILALNTEKAHNLREKSLETIRMARALAKQRATTRKRASLRVRAAGVPHARHLLRGAAAPERRRVSIDPAARRRVPRRADRQGDQGARAPRQEDPEAGRCGERGGREAEGERADQPVPEAVRRRRASTTRASRRRRRSTSTRRSTRSSRAREVQRRSRSSRKTSPRRAAARRTRSRNGRMGR